MNIRKSLYIVLGCLFSLGTLSLGVATGVEAPTWMSEPPPASSKIEPEGKGASQERPPVVEATIINAFRTANVGTDVGGIIESVNFDEGDHVKEGEVVVQLFKERYKMEVRKMEEKVRGLEALLEVAEQEAKAREELLKMESATRLEVLRAGQQLAAAQSSLAEARVELDKAKHDLEACTVKAPFSGYIAARLKQPYETARPLDALFSLVDSDKVYAVAYVPEEVLHRFPLSSKAVFKHRTGREFSGTVDRIGKLMDPKTKTKKVYVLLNNPDRHLEIGMIGSLRSPAK